MSYLKKISLLCISLVGVCLLSCNNTPKTIDNSNTNINKDSLLLQLQGLTKNISVSTISASIKLSNRDVFFQKDKSKIISNNASLTVLLSNQKKIQFKNVNNTEDETTSENYKYSGYEKTRGLFWIKKELYEEEKHLIIDDTTGTIIEIWNIPILSINKNYIFCMQNPCFRVFDDCHPGFQIWKINGNNISILHEVQLTDYYVINAAWKSDNEILIELAPIDIIEISKDNQSKVKQYSIKIK